MASGSNTFGGTIKLQGEKEYRTAISNINSNLKVMGSELVKVTAEFGKNNTSTEALTAKNKILSIEIEKQKEKIETYNKALSELTKQQAENEKSHAKLKDEYDKEKQKLEELKKSMNASTEEVKKQEDKVESLEGQLKKSQEQYDINTRKINDWKISLNKTEAEVSGLQKEIEDNNKTMKKASDTTEENAKSIKEFSNEEKKAGEHTLKLGDLIKANLISDAIKSGLSTLAGAIKGIGSTLVDVGKKALESYGNYEQLVGGVETLFKDSADKVENYANNAYKTSGLSANEYMETVTSFSASLLKSLNGDTSKTAEIADMAITDMSDNANKMGTSMESIQNAYQGFAKQNYTMLDNLKLGYGGTKEEMQRLLKDAQKLTGVKYDIKNLNDVYTAIHAVQGELGITGTTAKEASITLQGSTSAMKSAWSNLLTGIADDNVDFQGLIDNLIGSVLTVADNMLPRVGIIIEGIGLLVEGFASKLLPKILELLPDLLEQILPQLVGTVQYLIEGVTTALPQLMSVISNIIPQLVGTLISLLPQILEAGITIVIQLVQGIAQSLPELIPIIVNAVILMVETLIDNIDLIIDARNTDCSRLGRAELLMLCQN